MPFFGNDFFGATDGLAPDQVVAYLRCIWHYWHHTQCGGLKDEDDSLMRICRCTKEGWQELKEILFDGDRFFVLGEDLKWHQKRAAQEWEKSLRKYQSNVNKTRAALEARQKKRNRE